MWVKIGSLTPGTNFCHAPNMYFGGTILFHKDGFTTYKDIGNGHGNDEYENTVPSNKSVQVNRAKHSLEDQFLNGYECRTCGSRLCARTNKSLVTCWRWVEFLKATDHNIIDYIGWKKRYE